MTKKNKKRSKSAVRPGDQYLALARSDALAAPCEPQTPADTESTTTEEPEPSQSEEAPTPSVTHTDGPVINVCAAEPPEPYQPPVPTVVTTSMAAPSPNPPSHRLDQKVPLLVSTDTHPLSTPTPDVLTLKRSNLRHVGKRRCCSICAVM
ncbi:hypothetical protein PAPYR_2219 [Paratrimastix pyriformis]|uniref:Uncharacterized protein n=1 Tax=Paratrimastix pyriformis TaxID=342808 RepID=A0ABQ8UPX0_9EUKA|nr:hypothetical protein PAPYR_2219 [Paratrimastix pyriformis]